MGKIEAEIFTDGFNLPYKNITIDSLHEFTIKISSELKIENSAINIIITDDEKIREINREYRDKDKATDVISFAYRENPFPKIDEEIEDLGDIYISFETAYKQSIEYKVEFDSEVKRLLVHGILHLLGYDHERSKEDADIMFALEEKVLGKIFLDISS